MATAFYNHHQVQGHATIKNQPANSTTIGFYDSRDALDDKQSANDFTIAITPSIPNVKKIQILQVSMPISFFPTTDQVLRWSWDNVGNDFQQGDVSWYAMNLDGAFTTQEKLNELANDMQAIAVDQGATDTGTDLEIFLTIDLNQKLVTYTNNPFYYRPVQGDPNVLDGALPQKVFSIATGDTTDDYLNSWDETLRPLDKSDKTITAMSTSHYGYPHVYNPMPEGKIETGVFNPVKDPQERTFAYKYTAPWVGTLQPNQYINLFTNIALNTSFSDKEKSGNIIAQIPVTDYGTTPVLNQQNFFPITIDEALVQNLNFQFKFYDSSRPNFDPNQNIGIVVKFWYNDPAKSQTLQHVGEPSMVG